MTEAYFISFEGIDGSGKTTMLRRLQQHLQAKSLPVVVTYEPGGSTLGQQLRRLLLEQQDNPPTARTEALLFGAERAAHVDEVIRPALLANKIVLCDRFCDSTLAYQGGGRGLNIHFLEELNLFATGGLMPDLSFFLTLPLEVARSRQNKHKDRLEQEDEAFYQRIISAYDRLAEQQPERIRLLDATLEPEQLLQNMLSYLPPHLR